MSLLPCPCGSTNIGGADREAAWCWDCGLTFDIQGYMPNGVPKSHQAWNDLSTKFSSLKSASSPKALETRRFHHTQILQAMCKLSGKWGMLIKILDWNDFDYVHECAPYLDPNNHDDRQLIHDGFGIFLADTEKELYALYNQSRGGDDARGGCIYALTCDPNGETQNENT